MIETRVVTHHGKIYVELYVNGFTHLLTPEEYREHIAQADGILCDYCRHPIVDWVCSGCGERYGNFGLGDVEEIKPTISPDARYARYVEVGEDK